MIPTVIPAAITVRPETKDVNFFWSVPPKFTGRLQWLNDDGTEFQTLFPVNNNTGHSIGFSIAIPFAFSISKIPQLVST